jgi:hypothetical protein
LPAVVDQRAQETEQAAGAGGCVRAGGRPILVRIGAVGWDGGGRGGHRRNKTHTGEQWQGILSSGGYNAGRAMGDGRRAVHYTEYQMVPL